MSNVITPETKQNVKAKPELGEAAQEIAASKAKAQANAEQAEYNAIVEADAAYSRAIVATGFNVLAKLAADMGKTVDKFGYPSLSTWRRFTSACAIRAIDHGSFNRLCGIVKANVGTDPDRRMSDEEVNAGREKVIRDKGKGANGKSSMTLSVKAPKAWDIALGE